MVINCVFKYLICLTQQMLKCSVLVIRDICKLFPELILIICCNDYYTNSEEKIQTCS